jgi:DnaJ-class molecular chaperone
MARIHTHYDNLKVARNAPPEVIRAAYKTLSQKYHPDRNPESPDAIRIIQIINSAYEVLSDPIKRQEHDDWIARTEARGEGSAGWSASNFSDAPGQNKKANRVRHRTPLRTHSSRRRRTSKLSRLVEKTRQMLDHFSKYLLRKG